MCDEFKAGRYFDSISRLLNNYCVPYWEGFGLEVIAKAGPTLETTAFHPICNVGRWRSAAYRAIKTNADGVLMLVIGMATPDRSYWIR